MLSYYCDFNLSFAGSAADDFIAQAAGTWPELWESIPGVRRTLLLSNAFALGGDFGYRWRIDIDSLSTLANIDGALKSDDGGWRRIRKHWFDARTGVRSTLTEYIAGAKDYYGANGDEEALIHCVVSDTDADAARKRADSARTGNGVVAVQSQRPVLAPFGTGHETWFRLAGLANLDQVIEDGGSVGARAQLFGEVREIDGALFVGA